MFLIEFQKARFIDAEKIDFISVENKVVKFTLTSEGGNIFIVDDELSDIFVNNLNALSQNIQSIQSRFNEEVKKEPVDYSQAPKPIAIVNPPF